MNQSKYNLLHSGSVAGALALALATPAFAQEAASPANPQTATTAPTSTQPIPPGAEDDPYADEGGEIVVTGVRRGSVIGDIPPENTLSTRDIRATGASDINELLDALAPQIGSARGRGDERPVLLLNGQRISGFREIRDIPPEAISRVEILPEEVALKYGYSADQRVVNFVLRERFRSTVARVDAETPTEGGWVSGLADMTQLRINKGSRLTTNLHTEGNTALTESERDVDLRDPSGTDDRAARTLYGSKKLVRGSSTLNQTVFGDVSATVNAEVEFSDGRSLFGLSDFALTPLVRDTNSETAHVGFSLNGNRGKWRWSSTGNGDITRAESRSDRANEQIGDRAETLTASADADLVANGPLFALPAGNASATFKVGASALHLDSVRRRNGEPSDNDLARTRGVANANIDLPISRRNHDFSALGNLTLNANAEIEQLSDFGTLTTIGAGMNWSPVERLNLITSWTREEGAPSVQQLGDPILDTPGTRVFDFTTGQTADVISTTGGNPDLLADRRNVLKIGGNWKPLKETDLNLRAEYVHTTIDNPISSFPGVTAAIQYAFPERFFRAPCAPTPCVGQLISADFRPVNYDSSRRDTIRIGFDFTKPLTSARPSQAAIERFRAMRNAQGGGRQSQANEGSPPPPPEGGPPPAGSASPEGGPPPGGSGFGPGGGFGGGFGRFGGEGGRGRQGGRLQFSLTDTITLVDEAVIRSGLPKLDYLNGDALGSTGGRPRHQLEAQAGYFNNGLGARLSANWRSGTRVDSTTGDDLHFSPLATFDLRLFANFSERFDLVSQHPWLRGASVRLEVENIFNSRPEVRNAAGVVPNTYQPDLLDPLGRTISISFRKLFLPPRGAFRRPQS